jgi:hypothetical protein
VERKKPAIQYKQRANQPARKVFNMKAKLCFVALLLSFSVMPSFGITLIDGDATQTITTTGTSWVAHAVTKDNEIGQQGQSAREMILSAGGETLYADNTFLADTTMPLTITYDGGALSWTLNGITLGVVRPTVEFNAIEFKLWTDGCYLNGGLELSNLSINGNPIAGSWDARKLAVGADEQMLFFCTFPETLSQISADLKLFSTIADTVPGIDMAHFTISGVNIIPEPSTILLSVIGLGALLLTKISYRKR